MTETPQTPAGWYHAEGDPVGTQRWWDGSQWIGAPQHNAPTNSAPGAPASPWKRIGGRIIDAIITGILFTLPFVVLVISRIDFDALNNDIESGGDFSAFEASITEAVNVNPLFTLVIAIASFLWDWLWTALRGGTPGKLMLGMRVASVGEREIPPGQRSSVLRALNRLVSGVPVVSFVVPLVGLASLIMLFAHPQRRTVMDLVAGTVVVEKP